MRVRNPTPLGPDSKPSNNTRTPEQRAEMEKPDERLNKKKKTIMDKKHTEHPCWVHFFFSPSPAMVRHKHNNPPNFIFIFSGEGCRLNRHTYIPTESRRRQNTERKDRLKLLSCVTSRFGTVPGFSHASLSASLAASVQGEKAGLDR
ncbi:hypothetical protein MPH_02103 [Macrophomina phaseolina MS6]|uniref:Uncharacterized protein n=1 Tax=Macrophomina phaseolina (strain MS6) TaxID=1126212 RepID=K2RDJ5_MACPH|nr:hypothetical protein MPH_02103 [Macrophomina phaseolina MS6]